MRIWNFMTYVSLIMWEHHDLLCCVTDLKVSTLCLRTSMINFTHMYSENKMMCDRFCFIDYRNVRISVNAAMTSGKPVYVRFNPLIKSILRVLNGAYKEFIQGDGVSDGHAFENRIPSTIFTIFKESWYRLNVI